jgi:lysozyme
VSSFDRQALLHEGFNGRNYLDSRGYWTIGYGHNLTAKPLSQAACQFILSEDLDAAVHDLFFMLPWAIQLDPIRQAVLIELCFAMGIHDLLQFKLMLQAIRSHLWDEAAHQLMDSVWATEVGHRAQELAFALMNGEWMV